MATVHAHALAHRADTAAAALGTLFLWRAWVLWKQGTAPEGSTQQAIRLYRYSITYLTLLFVAVAVDTLVVLG